jgi:hypothetical membrane protein
MKIKKQVSLILSILVIVVYLMMTMLSLLRYTESFSPVSNWLSDLGNRKISPDGSTYYNLGIFISGSLLTLFFISLGSNRMEGKRAQNIMLLLTQIFGIIGSIAMVMTGVFSIDNPQTHSLFSAILRICLGTAFGFSVAAFRYQKGINKWILIIGVITTLTDLLVSVFFNKTQLLEWPVISLFLIYCLLLGTETYRSGRIAKEKT